MPAGYMKIRSLEVILVPINSAYQFSILIANSTYRPTNWEALCTLIEKTTSRFIGLTVINSKHVQCILPSTNLPLLTKALIVIATNCKLMKVSFHNFMFHTSVNRNISCI